MSIWRRLQTLETLNTLGAGTMARPLGIVFTEIGEDFIRGTMPVDDRTRQPLGLLHGGASVALAETVGSLAAMLCVDPNYMALGQDINANHLRSISSGLVIATARPFHIGRTSHVWHIEIRDEQERLVCVSRLTIAVIERRTPPTPS